MRPNLCQPHFEALINESEHIYGNRYTIRPCLAVGGTPM